jgi:hypothetical protein
MINYKEKYKELHKIVSDMCSDKTTGGMKEVVEFIRCNPYLTSSRGKIIYVDSSGNFKQYIFDGTPCYPLELTGSYKRDLMGDASNNNKTPLYWYECKGLLSKILLPLQDEDIEELEEALSKKYTIEQFLAAAEAGEVSMIDAKHTCNILEGK